MNTNSRHRLKAKRAALAVLAALLVGSGCGGVLRPPKPPKPVQSPRDIPAIPRSFSLEQATRRRVDGVTLRVYDTASATARGSVVSSMKSWSSKTQLSALVFLIKHPRQGYLLFNTGPGPGKPDAQNGKREPFFSFESKQGQDIVAQLAADGIAAEQIRWVIVSDLRPEHAGMIDAFPKATIVMDAREAAEFEARPSLRAVDLSTEAAYGAFDHGIDFFADGSVFLVDLSGSSPGTMGLWASLDEGPALLTGDASWILDNHQDLALPAKSSISDLDSYWRRLYEMRAMQTAVPRLVIYPAYDLDPLKLQPRADVTAARFPR